MVRLGSCAEPGAPVGPAPGPCPRWAQPGMGGGSRAAARAHGEPERLARPVLPSLGAGGPCCFAPHAQTSALPSTGGSGTFLFPVSLFLMEIFKIPKYRESDRMIPLQQLPTLSQFRSSLSPRRHPAAHPRRPVILHMVFSMFPDGKAVYRQLVASPVRGSRGSSDPPQPLPAFLAEGASGREGTGSLRGLSPSC